MKTFSLIPQIPLSRRHALLVTAMALTAAQMPAWASDEAPDAFIKRITNDTLDLIKADKSLRSGDMTKLIQLVDAACQFPSNDRVGHRTCLAQSHT
jgi:ABC-type transporter MlaC component